MKRSEKLLKMYESMLRIRLFNQKEVEESAKGNIYGFLHCYTGQEAVAVGVCTELTETDAVFSTHRAEGHLVAMGVDPKAMMAEVFGKVTGTNHGTSGMMHMSVPEKGVIHSNGLVGGGIGLAVGAALAFKYRKEPGVAVSFFGDGAGNQGVLYEGMNLAALWKLPVLFVCENNTYAVATSVAESTSSRSFAERAEAFQLPVSVLEGQDVLKINEAAAKAVKRARDGKGPSFLEVKCDRWRGHNESDPQWYYRTKEEVEGYKKRCCITFMKKTLQEQGILTEEMDREIREKVERELSAAVEFASSSPFPDSGYATKYVWGAAK